jgi:tetratricopeptide (TPR) repeat protein
MDWGLAKELSSGEHDRAETTLGAHELGAADPCSPDDSQTRAGQVMGTPGYMAPEQARGEPADARSDVFSLGGILCAILTGKPPFVGDSAAETIQRTASADLADAIARLDSCGADAEVAALCRRCLSANPAHRPANGQAVADEITGYLNGVQERLRAAEIAGAEANTRAKAERRTRRIQLIAASLLLLVLAGGVVGTAIGLFRAKTAQEKAEFAEGEEKKRADELQKVSAFQSAMLRKVDAANTGVKLKTDLRARHAAALTKEKTISDADRSARTAAFERELQAVNGTDAAVTLLDQTVLAPAVRTIDQQFAEQPLVDASLRMTLGAVYSKLARFEVALALYQRAYQERTAELGERHLDTLTALEGVAEALTELERLSEAETTLSRLLESYVSTFGLDHPGTLDALDVRMLLLRKQGKHKELEDCGRDLLDRRNRVLGKDHIDTLRTMNSLGLCLLFKDNFAEAERLLRTVVEKTRPMPDQGQHLLISSLDNLSRALRSQGKSADAEPCLRESLELSRQLFGEDHPSTLIAIHNLAVLLQNLGKHNESEPFARESLEKSRRVRGNDHRETLVTLNVLGRVYALQGKYAEAEPYWREALATGRRVLGDDHPDTVAWINNLGNLLRVQDKLTEAEPLVHEALARFRKAHGDDHSSTLTALGNLGSLQRDLGKLAEAEASFREALDRCRRKLGEENQSTLFAINRLGSLMASQGNASEALALLAPAEARMRAAFPGKNMHHVAELLEAMGKARVALSKAPADFTVAEANLLEANDIFSKTRGPTSKAARNSAKTLSEAYAAWDKAEPGNGYDVKAAEWKAKVDADRK